MLVFNTNQCRDVKDWFQFYARESACPAWASTRRGRSARAWATGLVDYVAGQIEALVAPLEESGGDASSTSIACAR